MVLHKTGDMLRSIIPISRFHKGEAAKIFDEVADAGVKIVVKNNEPACVLLSPQKYEELMEEVEDVYLGSIAEKRLSDKNAVYHSMEDVMKSCGITQADLDAMDDVEIE